MNRITTGLIASLASLALLFVGAAPAESLVKRPISISAYDTALASNSQSVLS